MNEREFVQGKMKELEARHDALVKGLDRCNKEIEGHNAEILRLQKERESLAVQVIEVRSAYAMGEATLKCGEVPDVLPPDAPIENAKPKRGKAK